MRIMKEILQLSRTLRGKIEILELMGLNIKTYQNLS